MMKEILKIELKLYEKALQICKDEHKAKDAVQETFLWAIENDIYDTTNAMNTLVKLALKQLNYKEVFVPTSSNDEDYESLTSSYARKIEQKTAIDAPEVTEKVTIDSIDKSLLVKKKDNNRYKTFLKYEAAVAYMSTTGIRTKREFSKWCKTESKPSFIPCLPRKYYGKQFTTFEDFLGTKRFFSYEEAVIWVRANSKALGLTTSKSWFANKKSMPEKMPKDPQAAYKNKGWCSWAVFLGKEIIGRGQNRFKINFLPYDEAKQWVLSNLKPKGVNSGGKYFSASQHLPLNIPTNPQSVYKNKGWCGWSKFLENGNDNIRQEIYTKREYWPYKQAREWVRLNLRINGVTSFKKWRAYISNPNNPPLPKEIPKDPLSIYKLRGGWKSWGDFLGTLTKSNWEINKEFPTYSQLRVWLKDNMQGKEITSKHWDNWRKGHYTKKWPTPPFPLPSAPSSTYKKNWKGFKELNCFRNKLGVKIRVLSKAVLKMEDAIVRNLYDEETPTEFTRREFASRISSLAIRDIKFSSMLSYDDAENYTRNVLVPMGINNTPRYIQFVKSGNLPLFLPTQPYKYYVGKGWVSSSKFFGMKEDRKTTKKLPFIEAKKWVIENLVPIGINGQICFKKYDKLPAFIPKNPDKYYKNEWISYPDWFGREAITPRRQKSY